MAILSSIKIAVFAIQARLDFAPVAFVSGKADIFSHSFRNRTTPDFSHGG
jgi:hypothetical protein